jgi:hypothetical protein
MKFIGYEGDDESDPGYELVTDDGIWVGISIQDSTAYDCGYTVNVYGEECPESPLGGDFFMESAGVYGTLEEAKKGALDFYESIKDVLTHLDTTPYYEAIWQAHKGRFNEEPSQLSLWRPEGRPINPEYYEADSYDAAEKQRTRWAVTDGKIEHLHDAPADQPPPPPTRIYF